MLYTVKLPTNALTRGPVRDIVVEEALHMIRQDAEVYRYHVGFPEYVYLIIRKLRSFAKACKVSKWRSQARVLVSHMEAVSSEVKSARASLGQNPAEVKDFEPLLGGGAPPAAQRLSKLLMRRGGDGDGGGGAHARLTLELEKEGDIGSGSGTSASSAREKGKEGSLKKEKKQAKAKKQ